MGLQWPIMAYGPAWRQTAVNSALQRAFSRAVQLAFTRSGKDSVRRPDKVADVPWIEDGRLAWDAACVRFFPLC